MTLDKILLMEALGLAKIAEKNGWDFKVVYQDYLDNARRYSDPIERRDYCLGLAKLYRDTKPVKNERLKTDN